MTRGKIMYIAGTGIMHSSCEFNGDMYPSSKGDQIIEKFQAGGFESVFDFNHYVERFNERNFGYDEPFGSEEPTQDAEWMLSQASFIQVLFGNTCWES